MAAHEERLRLAAERVARRERNNYRRSVAILAVSFALGFGWLAYSVYKVWRLDKEYDQKSELLKGASRELADKQDALVKIKSVLDECKQGRCDRQKVAEALGYVNSELAFPNVEPLTTPTPTPTPSASSTPVRPTPTPGHAPTPTPMPTPTPTPAEARGGFVNLYHYVGKRGTRISVEVSAERTPQLVSLNVDGNPLELRGNRAAFTLDKPAGTAVSLLMNFSFQGDDPLATYNVRVVSSDGSSSAFRVRQGKSNYLITMTFDIK